MFGIGLPELILIMGIALIVVGPEKLPEMARSLARIALDLKKTVADFKENLDEQMKEESASEPWQPPVMDAAQALPSPDAVSGQGVAEPAEAESGPEQVAATADSENKEGTPAG